MSSGILGKIEATFQIKQLTISGDVNLNPGPQSFNSFT